MCCNMFSCNMSSVNVRHNKVLSSCFTRAYLFHVVSRRKLDPTSQVRTSAPSNTYAYQQHHLPAQHRRSLPPDRPRSRSPLHNSQRSFSATSTSALNRSRSPSRSVQAPFATRGRVDGSRASDVMASGDPQAMEKMRDAERLYMESLSRAHATSNGLNKLTHSSAADPYSGLTQAAKHAYISRTPHLPVPPVSFPTASLFDRHALLPPNPLPFDPLLMSPAHWATSAAMAAANGSSAAAMLEQLTRREQQVLMERQRDAMLAQRSVLDRESLIEYERRVMSGVAAARDAASKLVTSAASSKPRHSPHASPGLQGSTNNNYSKYVTSSSADGRRSRAAISPPSRASSKGECVNNQQQLQLNGHVSMTSSPTPESSLGAPPPLIPTSSALPDSIQTPPDSIKLDTNVNYDSHHSLTPVNSTTHTHLSLNDNKQMSPQSVTLVADARVRSSDDCPAVRPVNGINKDVVSLAAVR